MFVPMTREVVKQVCPVAFHRDPETTTCARWTGSRASPIHRPMLTDCKWVVQDSRFQGITPTDHETVITCSLCERHCMAPAWQTRSSPNTRGHSKCGRRSTPRTMVIAALSCRSGYGRRRWHAAGGADGIQQQQGPRDCRSSMYFAHRTGPDVHCQQKFSVGPIPCSRVEQSRGSNFP